MAVAIWMEKVTRIIIAVIMMEIRIQINLMKVEAVQDSKNVQMSVVLVRMIWDNNIQDLRSTDNIATTIEDQEIVHNITNLVSTLEISNPVDLEMMVQEMDSTIQLVVLETTHHNKGKIIQEVIVITMVTVTTWITDPEVVLTKATMEDTAVEGSEMAKVEVAWVAVT